MIEIAKLLKAKGLRSKVLREEYLDHYCSQYEALREEGHLHDPAIEIIEKEILKMNIKKAHQAYFDLHFKKPVLMTSIIALMLSILFALPSSDIPIMADHNCIDEVEYQIVAANFDDPPSINPIIGNSIKVYSDFGMRLHPKTKVKKMHTGVDIKGSIGTPVIAPSDGTIIEAGFEINKGNFIEIKHDEIYSTRYYHLHKIDVKVNQEITKGSKIGEIGSSGASIGPHLHYEVIKDGKPVNPRDYLKV